MLEQTDAEIIAIVRNFSGSIEVVARDAAGNKVRPDGYQLSELIRISLGRWESCVRRLEEIKALACS